MNRIDQLFQEKRQNILSVYFTAGFPELNDTLPVLQALEKGGIDLVEIGIPFSDPMADGPIIQESSSIALKNGMSIEQLFAQLKDVRSQISIPLIFMGYLNPIMQYGIEKFCKKCVETGIDGLIIPDLPYDIPDKTLTKCTKDNDLRLIRLITPETSPERIRMIDAHSSGFLYMVSTAATTGAKKEFPKETIDYFRRVSEMSLTNPLLVGFGICNQDTYQTACQYTSGAIIGSHFIRLLASEKQPLKAVHKLLADVGHHSL